MGGIPQVTVADLDTNPSLASRFAGKVVFAGVTAQTATDRWMTPYSNGIIMPGVEMHANAYETLARQMFLVDVPLLNRGRDNFSVRHMRGAGLRARIRMDRECIDAPDFRGLPVCPGHRVRALRRLAVDARDFRRSARHRRRGGLETSPRAPRTGSGGK